MIVKNTDGKKLWGADNVVYFKSICATYKIHYKLYRNTTVYEEATVDIGNGANTVTLNNVLANTVRFLNVEFFDKDGNKFLPHNWEWVSKLKGDAGGNGILTIFADGTIRINVENKLEDVSASAYTHTFKFEWDSVNEEIDNRKVTIAFDFA